MKIAKRQAETKHTSASHSPPQITQTDTGNDRLVEPNLCDLIPFRVSDAALGEIKKSCGFVRIVEPCASKQRIWKYWVLWLGWIFGSCFGVQVSAATCESIGSSSPMFCICESGTGNASRAGSWDVNFSGSSGFPWALDDINVKYCANITDTSCSSPRPNSLTDGSTLFLKRASDGTHYACNVALGSDLVSVAYTPTGTTTPISASILDFNQPAEVFSEEINVME